MTDKRLEQGGNNQIAAFVDINLYIKIDGEWSKPIPGTGGSMFVANESKGLHTSDECFKMAQTDAVSVACKALGFGADIYWQKDKTKYNDLKNGSSVTYETAKETFDDISPEEVPDSKLQEAFPDGGYEEPNEKLISEAQQKRLFALAGYKEDKDVAKNIVQKLLTEYNLKTTGEIKKGKEYNEICDKAEVMLADHLVPAGPDVGDGDNMPLY